MLSCSLSWQARKVVDEALKNDCRNPIIHYHQFKIALMQHNDYDGMSLHDEQPACFLHSLYTTLYRTLSHVGEYLLKMNSY